MGPPPRSAGIRRRRTRSRLTLSTIWRNRFVGASRVFKPNSVTVVKCIGATCISLQLVRFHCF